MCTYIDTCVQDLANFAQDVNRIVESDKSTENQRTFGEACSDMLKFHIDILELMKNLKIIMNGPLFFQLLVYAVFIAMNLLQFDEMLKHFDFDILLNLNSLFTQLFFNYISCYYANNVTIKSFAAAEISYGMNWYVFPVNRQLLICLMVQRAQKPFYLKGYDIVDCSLTTFLNFIKTAVSFYLVFKQFGN
ncbi:putative odorant receptor 69a [Sitodiplosis mosellana]|uniref:putative odorant receptor 69a n=1 Tax=Sitodiplosis mosellana TaxID=263140 RepID=UPI002444A873|nr:putative odorant receptor 69a [Sitodiplosis mosellana]